MELRQSTEIKVRIGPFLDATDGKTPETDITLGAADQAEILKANGVATVDISGATWAAVSDCDGWYDLTITTSTSDTLGHLSVVVQDDSVCLPVFGEFQVVTQNYWDSKYSTDKLQVDLTQIEGAAVATGTAQLGVNVVTEANIDFGALKKTSLDASTPASVQNISAQTGDSYAIVNSGTHGNAKLVRSTTPANALDVSATGEAGLDFANIKDATGAHTLTNITVPVTTAVTNEVTADAVKISGDSTAANNAELAFDGTGYGFANCTIPTVTTLTGHTAQTGDSFARIGAAGASLTDLGGMSSGMQTEVNNQVVDVIRTDTTSEMSQGAPPATPTFEEMVAYVYFRLRNKRVVSETEDATYDDAGTTKLFKAAVEEVSDVFTKSEYVTGA